MVIIEENVEVLAIDGTLVVDEGVDIADMIVEVVVGTLVDSVSVAVVFAENVVAGVVDVGVVSFSVKLDAIACDFNAIVFGVLVGVRVIAIVLFSISFFVETLIVSAGGETVVSVVM